MFKRIALFCALIGLVAIAGSAYAEVQNIKVSGDIEALAVYRNNYDLEDEFVFDYDDSNNASQAGDTDSFLMSIIRLQVDADLTDNVAASVRVANLREWDASGGAENEDIVLDLANVTLREMLYSPLTMIIGRQELNYGNGLIVGNGRYLDESGTLAYTDLSTLHGYDAVQAILDYDPLTLSLVMAKITENDDAANQDRDGDTDLYGVNASYVFDSYDAEAEAYMFYKRDENYNLVVGRANSPSNGRTFEENEVYTLGLRGSVVPVENLALNGELAFQLGELTDGQAGPDDNPLALDRDAMAVNVAGTYALADLLPYAPVIGVEYLYLSGEEETVTGDFDAWDPMYRGKVTSAIRDYIENLYATADPTDTSGWTNQHTIKAIGSLDLGELVDGLSLDLAYLYYWFDEEPVAGVDDHIGDEINLSLTYDYTEDVQFALDGAWFIPGDYYDNLHTIETLYGTGSGLSTSTTTAQAAQTRSTKDTAVSIVGSCKVTF